MNKPKHVMLKELYSRYFEEASIQESEPLYGKAPEKRKPQALSDLNRSYINQRISEEGTSPSVIDDIMASIHSSPKRKPRKWSVEGYGGGMKDGVVDKLSK